MDPGRHCSFKMPSNKCVPLKLREEKTLYTVTLYCTKPVPGVSMFQQKHTLHIPRLDTKSFHNINTPRLRLFRSINFFFNEIFIFPYCSTIPLEIRVKLYLFSLLNQFIKFKQQHL